MIHYDKLSLHSDHHVTVNNGINILTIFVKIFVTVSADYWWCYAQIPQRNVWMSLDWVILKHLWWIDLFLIVSFFVLWCFSGRIACCHHCGPGSIPKQRTNPDTERLTLSASLKPVLNAATIKLCGLNCRDQEHGGAKGKQQLCWTFLTQTCLSFLTHAMDHGSWICCNKIHTTGFRLIISNWICSSLHFLCVNSILVNVDISICPMWQKKYTLCK